MRRRRALFLFLMLSLSLGQGRAKAGTFNVDSTNDEADFAPGDGICKSVSGVCSLRAAFEESNALSGIDEINVPAGTYVLASTLEVSDDLALVGAGKDLTIIDAQGSARVVKILAGSFRAEGITFTNGDWAVIDDESPGLFELHDSNVLGTPTSLARGIFILSGTALVENTLIDSNNDTGVLNHGTLTIRRSTISNNRSSDAGGLDNADGTATIEDSLIAKNKSTGSAGGIGNCCSLGSLTLRRTLVRFNVGEQDGGISTCCGAKLIGEDTMIYRNGARLGSGGVGSCCGSSVNLERVLISGNTGYLGGGVGTCCGDAISLVNATLFSNISTTNGGAILNRGASFVAVQSSTIMWNVAEVGGSNYPIPKLGGGVYSAPGSGGAISLEGVILESNHDAYFYIHECGGDPITSLGHNLVSSIADCTIQGNIESDLVGVDAGIAAVGPAQNGGFVATVALTEGSPAIDAGGDTCPATDARGVRRPQGAACDIGAYEFVPMAPPPVLDSDGDGVLDSVDQCPSTRAGDAVDSQGCACSQKTCDDGNPCNGVETCDVATVACRSGSIPQNLCAIAACASEVTCKGKLLTYRGAKLTKLEDAVLRFMANTVVPMLTRAHPDRSARLRAVAETSWWAIDEGSFDVAGSDCGQAAEKKTTPTPCPGIRCKNDCDVHTPVTNPNLFSNCSRLAMNARGTSGYCGNFHLYCKPLELCDPDPCKDVVRPDVTPGVCAWQVGIVAAQVPRYGNSAACSTDDECKNNDATAEANVKTKIQKILGTNQVNLFSILAESIRFSGLDPSTGTGKTIADSDAACEAMLAANGNDTRAPACQLRRAWLVRHPAVGVLVEDDLVKPLCSLPANLADDCLGPCGGTGKPSCRDQKELYHLLDTLSPP